MKNDSVPSKEYINFICELYGDIYDDRIEDCKPPTAGAEIRDPGKDWNPGQEANHKSLNAFQKELTSMGIKISTSKIRKVLITGGVWTTERSRKVAELFECFTKPVEAGGKGLPVELAVKMIAETLEVSVVTVSINLPYQNVVYKLEKCSSNAKRCAKYRNQRLKNDNN